MHDSHQQLIHLRHILTERLSESELRTLCFDLNIDYDNLPGNNKSDRARELLLYVRSRHRISEVILYGSDIRSDIQGKYKSTTYSEPLTEQQESTIIATLLNIRSTKDQIISVDRNAPNDSRYHEAINALRKGDKQKGIKITIALKREYTSNIKVHELFELAFKDIEGFCTVCKRRRKIKIIELITRERDFAQINGTCTSCGGDINKVLLGL